MRLWLCDTNAYQLLTNLDLLGEVHEVRVLRTPKKLLCEHDDQVIAAGGHEMG